MADSLPIQIQLGALPPNVKWTPQQFGDALVSRMRLVTAQTFSLFVSGSTEPGSNVGPWLKNGNSWWVWSATAGAYVPITIEPESLGYWIGPDAPDHTVFSFWIETTAGGSPLALKIYFGGGWVDVYATTLSAYLTIASAAATYLTITDAAATYLTLAAAAATYLTQANAAAIYKTIASFNADIANYSTTAQMNTAISAALTPYAPLASPAFTGTPTSPTAAPGTNTTQIASTAFVTAAIAAIPPNTPFAAYPAQGAVTAQTIAIDGAAHQVQFASAPINPSPAPFNTGTYRYVAPAAGYYNVSFGSQFDNDTGTASGMQVAVSLYKNGVFVGDSMADLDNTPSPTGSRWSPGFSGLVQLATNDYLEIFAEITDGVNTGNITLTVAQFSINRVSA